MKQTYKYFGKLLLLTTILFFSLNISTVDAGTLYWYSTGNTEWGNNSNWWTSAAHVVQASVPTNDDDAFLLGAIAPVADMDTWTVPASINSIGLTGSAKAGGVIFEGSNNDGLTITVTGNATFNDVSNTLGVIMGNAIFNEGSTNESLVFGNAVFNGDFSNNNGMISGNVTFNNNSYNSTNGIINGNVVYTNYDYSQIFNRGLIKGDATLNFASNGLAVLNETTWSTVLGTTKGVDGQIITNWEFLGWSINTSEMLSGTSTFNEHAHNYGTTTNSVFNDSAYNNGTVLGNAIFNDDSLNGRFVNGISVFNTTSKNAFGTIATSTFNNSAKNYGKIMGDATFNDESASLGPDNRMIIYGNVLLNGDASKIFSQVNGTKTRRYTNNITPEEEFSGEWTIIADGATVMLGWATYDAEQTTLISLNGGSINETIIPDKPPYLQFPIPIPEYQYSAPPSVWTNSINISNVSAVTSTNSAIVSWTTEIEASSIVNASNQTFGLSLTNSTPKTAHSLTLSGLASCSTYSYKVAAVASSNVSISDLNSFTTSGCVGNAGVISATSSKDVSTATGETVVFNSGDGRKLTLYIPTNFTATSTFATFQLTRIDTTALITAASRPAGLETVNSNTYQLIALTDVSTVLSTFISPLSITIKYLLEDIDGIDPSTLKIYRYDEGEDWVVLTNCSTNTSANSVTCETDHFSVFSLFGTLPTNTTTANSSGGSRRAFINTASTTDPAIINAIEITKLKKQLLVIMKQLLEMLIEELKKAQSK